MSLSRPPADTKRLTVTVLGSLASLYLVGMGGFYVFSSRPVGGAILFSLGAAGIAAAVWSLLHREKQERDPVPLSWQSERRWGAVMFLLFLAVGAFSIYVGTRGNGLDLAIGIVLSIIPLLVGVLGLRGVVRAGKSEPDGPRSDGGL